MEPKEYLTPGMRIIPMTVPESFCTSAGDSGFDGSVPDYDPIDDFKW